MCGCGVVGGGAGPPRNVRRGEPGVQLQCPEGGGGFNHIFARTGRGAEPLP